MADAELLKHDLEMENLRLEIELEKARNKRYAVEKTYEDRTVKGVVKRMGSNIMKFLSRIKVKKLE